MAKVSLFQKFPIVAEVAAVFGGDDAFLLGGPARFARVDGELI
jgi:hypothetical protein